MKKITGCIKKYATILRDKTNIIFNKIGENYIKVSNVIRQYWSRVKQAIHKCYILVKDNINENMAKMKAKYNNTKNEYIAKKRLKDQEIALRKAEKQKIKEENQAKKQAEAEARAKELEAKRAEAQRIKEEQRLKKQAEAEARAKELEAKRAEKQRLKAEQIAKKEAEIAEQKAKKAEIENQKRAERKAKQDKQREEALKLKAEKQAKRDEANKFKKESKHNIINANKSEEDFVDTNSNQAKNSLRFNQTGEDTLKVLDGSSDRLNTKTNKPGIFAKKSDRANIEDELQNNEKIKANKIKEAQAKAKADEKARQAEIKKQEQEEKRKQRAEARANKEKERLAKKREASRNTKIDKKQVKRLQELELALENNNVTSEEITEIEQVKSEAKKHNKKKSEKLDDLLNFSISSKKYMTIEIKEDKTYIAELAVNGSKSLETKRVTVLDSYEIPTPPETFVNGSLTNIQRIAIELIKVIANSGMRAKDVIWISEEQSILQRSLEEFPIQKDAKSNLEIVNSRAIDIFPVDLDDYILRYKVLREYNVNKDSEEVAFSATGDLKEMAKALKKSKNIQADIQVIAFPKKVQELYTHLGDLCGVNTKAIEYSNNGLVNLLKREYRDDSAVIVDIEERNTYIYIINDGGIIYQTKISTGYKSMVDKLLAYGDKLIGTTPSEIYKNIKKYNLLEESVEAISLAQKELGFSEEYNIELNSLIDDIRYDIGSMIDKIMYAVADSKSIDETFEANKIHIICNEINFPDLTDDLSNASHIETHIKNNYEWINTIDDINISDYIHSIGATIEPINFKSDAKKQESKLKNKKIDRAAVAVLIIGLAGCAGTYAYLNHQYNQAVRNKTDLNIKLEEAHEAETLSRRAALSMSTLRSVTDFVGYSSYVDLAYDVISDLEKVTPKTTVFATIIASEQNMTMTVYTETRYDAIKILDEIEQLKYFNSVSTQGIQSMVESSGSNNEALGNYMIVISCSYADPSELEAKEAGMEG